MSQQGAVVFEFDEVLFDEFPKAPWVPRNQRIVVDSDRRVVGRRDGVVVSVTDLPPVYAHADIGPRISSMQSFVTVGDQVAWIVRTVEGTRFTSSADDLDEEARLEIARDATLHGFLDDLECMVIADLSEMRFGQDRELTRCRLEVTRASGGPVTWALVVEGTGHRIESDTVEAAEFVGRQLNDIAIDGDPLALEAVLPL
jgi:hypothetical protein